MNEVKLHDDGQGVEATIVAEDPEDNDDKDWVSLNELGENIGLPHDGKRPQTISGQIAQVSTEQSLNRSIPDRDSRNSSCRTSLKRQRRSHHLQLADFVLRYSGYTWPWSLGTSLLSTIWSLLRFGRIKIGASCSALCVLLPVRGLIC